jgi:hypothetical protein
MHHSTNGNVPIRPQDDQSHGGFRLSGLAMKVSCERCSGSLDFEAAAYICSYECTFCETCSAVLNETCPNCGGELVRRPRRKTGPSTIGGLPSQEA